MSFWDRLRRLIEQWYRDKKKDPEPVETDPAPTPTPEPVEPDPEPTPTPEPTPEPEPEEKKLIDRLVKDKRIKRYLWKPTGYAKYYDPSSRHTPVMLITFRVDAEAVSNEDGKRVSKIRYIKPRKKQLIYRFSTHVTKLPDSFLIKIEYEGKIRYIKIKDKTKRHERTVTIYKEK